MKQPAALADLSDDELIDLCLQAVFELAQLDWNSGQDASIWRQVLDEAYLRGWTDKRVTVETIALN